MEEFSLGQFDYDLMCGLEELVNGDCRVDHDFYRMVVHTERCASYLGQRFGKVVPVGERICLDGKEFNAVHESLASGDNPFMGTFGGYMVKAYDSLGYCYGEKSALATDEDYEYYAKWSEL